MSDHRGSSCCTLSDGKYSNNDTINNSKKQFYREYSSDSQANLLLIIHKLLVLGTVDPRRLPPEHSVGQSSLHETPRSRETGTNTDITEK